MEELVASGVEIDLIAIYRQKDGVFEMHDKVI
jgi:hypothetical protein